jgi:CDP-glucose 4,6-dehydratase
MDKMVGKETLFDGVYINRRVLVTGHTGFKGSWLCLLLNELGADIYGYALNPPTSPSLFEEARIDELVTSYIGDIRDYSKLAKVLKNIRPEIIIHLAAQPLVQESYKHPIDTYAVNLMGLVNLFEACRRTDSVKSIVNVTSDKCYANNEWHWGYRESDVMGGFDPYSNSKACAELITASYRNSFFNEDNYTEHGIGLASARAGNVIGGGDWAKDRLIPDFIRAISNGEEVQIRMPHAVRPWQHVLEPLSGYLSLAAKMIKGGGKYAAAWNFGPGDEDAKSVKWITKTICDLWGEGASFVMENEKHQHEAAYLKLDCSKAKSELKWTPRWDIYYTLKSIVEWNKAFIAGGDMRIESQKQINAYLTADSSQK